MSYSALNDVIVNKSAMARLNTYDLFIDKAFVTTYKADGLIISTPTGRPPTRWRPAARF